MYVPKSEVAEGQGGGVDRAYIHKLGCPHFCMKDSLLYNSEKPEVGKDNR